MFNKYRLEWPVNGEYKKINYHIVKDEMTEEQVNLLTIKCQKAELKLADNLTYAISCSFSDKGLMPSGMIDKFLGQEDENKNIEGEELTPTTRRNKKYGKWLKEGSMTLIELYKWMEKRQISVEKHFEKVELERIRHELNR